MFKTMKKRIEDGEQQQNSHLRTPIKSTPRSSTPQYKGRKVLSSTPKKPSKSDSNSSLLYTGSQRRDSSKVLPLNSGNQQARNVSRENKWERRRLNTTASLTSSRESLYSIDSSATAQLSRISFNNGKGESSYSTIDTPSDSPMIIERVRVL